MHSHEKSEPDQTIIAFPLEHRSDVELFSVRDRTDGRRIFIFKLVGRDEDGPYRIDVAQRYSLQNALADIVDWWRYEIDVQDGVMLT